MTDDLGVLKEALQLQRTQLSAYEQRSPTTVLETLRAVDDVICRELFEAPERLGVAERRARSIMSWGINHALRRVMPLHEVDQGFRPFPSHDGIQAQADDFLLKCGSLELGERFYGWLEEGLMHIEVRHHQREGLPAIDPIVIKPNSPTLYDEMIGQAGLRWSSDRRVVQSQSLERELNRRHKSIRQRLNASCSLESDWRPSYPISDDLDDYFSQCAAYYLDRIFSRDLIGDEDTFGGLRYRSYVKVVRELSGRAHRRLAYAQILKRRYPAVDWRNLLTGWTAADELEPWLAGRLMCDIREARTLLDTVTLSSRNLSAHLERSDTVWAPAVQADPSTYFLPMYGLDINPYLFLHQSLRTNYETDWFVAANKREQRWIDELDSTFAKRGLQAVAGRKLRESGKILTDVDYAAFDFGRNELLLFQLKWQQPIGMANRARRSTGKNLLNTANKWVETVQDWIGRNSGKTLAQSLGFRCVAEPTIFVFVLARYGAHFTGFGDRSSGATWSSWDNFRRALVHVPRGSFRRVVAALTEAQAELRRRGAPESLFVPLGNTVVVVNPVSEPANPQRQPA